MPDDRPKNDTKVKCANCGHAASAHAEDGYGACDTKTCRGRSEPCLAYVFPAETGEGAAPESTEPEAAPDPTDADDDGVTTEETRPNDAVYDPTRPFNPSDHMRVLVHKNRQGEVVGESHYLDVKWRLAWLRSGSGVVDGHLKSHPDWRIESECLMDPGDMVASGFALFRARLFGRTTEDGEEWIQISEAHGSEQVEDWKDYIEKAETKAIGRCLANAGYGTAAAAEFEEGDRIADAGVQIGGSRQKRDPLVGEDGVPHPDCQAKGEDGENLGHGAGAVKRMMAKYADRGGRWEKGEEIYWCARKGEDGQSCGWANTVKAWREYLAALNADDPGDPNVSPSEAESLEPAPGESPTPSSASAEGSTSGETASPSPSSSGTPPSASSRSQRPTPPTPSADSPPPVAFDVQAFQAGLTESKLTIVDVQRVWNIERPNGPLFEAFMNEKGWTPQEFIDATVARIEAG